MSAPPITPGHTPPRPPKNFRRAFMLNFFLPGAGQFYLGQRVLGSLLAGGFLVCLLAVLTIFFLGYAEYFRVTLGGDILEGNRLEELGGAFHPRWLIGLMIGGLAIYLAAMVFLAVRQQKEQPG